MKNQVNFFMKINLIFTILILVILNSCTSNKNDQINNNKIKIIDLKYDEGFIIDGGYYKNENSKVLIIPVRYKFVNTSEDIFFSGGSSLLFEFKNVNNNGMDLNPIDKSLELIMFNSKNEKQLSFSQIKPFKKNDTISCIGFLNLNIYTERYSNTIIDQGKHLEFILKEIPFVLKTSILFSGNNGKEIVNEILHVDSTDNLKNIVKSNYYNKNIEIKEQLGLSSMVKFFEKKYKIKYGEYEQELEFIKKHPYLKYRDSDRY